jgi:hypothetical protein
MKDSPMTEDPLTFQGSGLRSWGRTWLAAVCLWVSTSGCGPAESPSEPLELDSRTQELSSHNGVSANGLSANGLSANGLSANGLSANGLSAAAFASWFTQNPSDADMLMTYVVRCAVPAGQSRSFTNPRNGRTYTWQGGLGLAPDWASGHSINHNEQQVVTSCLLAHVNRFGRHINISVLGLNAWGHAIPFTFGELALYDVREACFFGNLFTPNSLFFGVDQSVSDESRYVTRACGALEPGSDSPPQCAPLRFVGRCSQFCSSQGSSGLFYTSCTYNGVSYRPLTTRMRVSDFDELFPDSDD